MTPVLRQLRNDSKFTINTKKDHAKIDNYYYVEVILPTKNKTKLDFNTLEYSWVINQVTYYKVDTP